MAEHEHLDAAVWQATLFRLLMENVRDYAILLLDAEGQVVAWNKGAERILGYQDGELHGFPFARIFTAEDVEDCQPEHELRVAMERGKSEDERWHIRKDGSRIWASGVVTPLWDDSGNLRGFVKILRDITERKRTESELAEANQRKDEFLAMLSHELRNPLAPILNAVQIIQKESQTPAAIQAGNIIERQMHHLVRLVDDLLDVSRITRGKVQLCRERVELHAVVAYAVETTRSLIEVRKHELSISLPSESLWLDGDSARLAQVLANLLNNAAKYTEPGGHIGLSAEREGAQVVVQVKDTGIGILAEMLPRIFDLFVQADRSLDRSQGGLGIGLTLAWIPTVGLLT